MPEFYKCGIGVTNVMLTASSSVAVNCLWRCLWAAYLRASLQAKTSSQSESKFSNFTLSQLTNNYDDDDNDDDDDDFVTTITTFRNAFTSKPFR